MDAPDTIFLPCPLSAGWEVVEQRLIEPNQGGGLSRSPVDGYLLMAAEKPLLQDPADRVRLLRWVPDASGALQPAELRPLAQLPGGWGLTDLLATKQGLLGLWRLFTAPDQWQARLVLYPASAITTNATSNADAPPVAPLISWNLLQLGLAPDKREVLLASDDNFNPLQRSHLARLVPPQQ